MLAPRSFLFSRNKSTSSPTSNPDTNISSLNSNSTSTTNTTFVETSKTRDSYVQPVRASIIVPVQEPNEPIMAVALVAPVSRSSTSEPVVIPARNPKTPTKERRQSAKRDPRHNVKNLSEKDSVPRMRNIHSPDAIPPSVAALLAMTAIPQRKRNATRKISAPSQRLTVDAILRHTKGTESEYSLSMSRSPLDILLSISDDDGDLDTVESDLGNESYLLARSMSTDSIPSLAESSMYDSSLSLQSLMTPASQGPLSPSPRRRRVHSLSSPPRESTHEHPLSDTEDLDVQNLDFGVFDTESGGKVSEDSLLGTSPSRRSAFKSNLTASLKALKAAAISFSTMAAGTPMLTPEDFLTRSMITIDPRVPFTDERMPPRLEDTPTPAQRRYLNPTMRGSMESHMTMTCSAKCTASIQMQTYKSSKSSKASSPKVPSRRSSVPSPIGTSSETAAGPAARQREMRENSDFIRIAVMEMLMRKNGKLDDKVPGHAKWALPPRRPSTHTPQIGEGGVPARWIAVTA